MPADEKSLDTRIENMLPLQARASNTELLKQVDDALMLAEGTKTKLKKLKTLLHR